MLRIPDFNPRALAAEVLDELAEDCRGLLPGDRRPVPVWIAADGPLAEIAEKVVSECLTLLEKPRAARVPNDYGNTGGCPLVLAAGESKAEFILRCWFETTTDPKGWLGCELRDGAGNVCTRGGWAVSAFCGDADA
jgi:hypothetical protein